MARPLPRGVPGPRRKGWGTRTGIKGVYPTPGGRFAARLRWAKRLIHVGTFDTAGEAQAAYEAKLREVSGGARGAA